MVATRSRSGTAVAGSDCCGPRPPRSPGPRRAGAPGDRRRSTAAGRSPPVARAPTEPRRSATARSTGGPDCPAPAALAPTAPASARHRSTSATSGSAMTPSLVASGFMDASGDPPRYRPEGGCSSGVGSAPDSAGAPHPAGVVGELGVAGGRGCRRHHRGRLDRLDRLAGLRTGQRRTEPGQRRDRLALHRAAHRFAPRPKQHAQKIVATKLPPARALPHRGGALPAAHRHTSRGELGRRGAGGGRDRADAAVRAGQAATRSAGPVGGDGRGRSASTWSAPRLAATILVGLFLNVAFGIWWADPIAALILPRSRSTLAPARGVVRAADPPPADSHGI